MSQNQSQAIQAQESRSIEIADRDEVRMLDYQGLEAFHSGDSWWGCTVGFRAMQAAAIALSEIEPWQRQHLYIVSAHPGPGVLDAIEFVTGCIGRKRFRKICNPTDNGCSRDMRYEWWVSNGKTTAYIRLRPDFVPESFYQLLDRLGTDNERNHDRYGFGKEKDRLSAALWNESLDSALSVTRQRPLDIGETPHA